MSLSASIQTIWIWNCNSIKSKIKTKNTLSRNKLVVKMFAGFFGPDFVTKFNFKLSPVWSTAAVAATIIVRKNVLHVKFSIKRATQRGAIRAKFQKSTKQKKKRTKEPIIFSEHESGENSMFNGLRLISRGHSYYIPHNAMANSIDVISIIRSGKKFATRSSRKVRASVSHFA